MVLGRGGESRDNLYDFIFINLGDRMKTLIASLNTF